MYHLTRLALAYPKTAIALLIAITAFLGAGLPRVRSEYGYRVLVGDEHPSIRALDALIEHFGGGLPAQIAWACGEGRPCKDVFDAVSLRMADQVSRELAASEGVRTAMGPANAPLLISQTGGFAVRRLVENERVATDAERLRDRALHDRMWNGRLVSSDGTVGVIVVQPADTRPATDKLVVTTIQSVLAPFEDQGFRFYIAGDAAENYLGGRDLEESNSRLVPLAILVIGGMLYFLSRSWSQTLAVLLTMGATLLWTFGLLGWLGWPRDGILEVLAPLLLIVGVCDSMHLLARLAELRMQELPGSDDPDRIGTKQGRLVEAARDVGGACTFTTLTDAGAFASVSTSALDTFVRFGFIAAFGVMAALILSFSLLPLLICRVRDGRPRTRRTRDRLSAWLGQIERLSRTRSRTILAISGSSLLLFGFCWIFLLEVDTDWLESWGDRSELTRSIRFIEQRVGDAKSVELHLSLPSGASIDDPQIVRVVERLDHSLANLDGVSGTTSILNLVSRVNRLIHDDDPAFERTPERAGATAEIMELLSLDDETILGPWISIDRSHLRLSIETGEFPYQEGRRFVETVRESVSRVLPQGWVSSLTGEVPITVDWVDDVQQTQLRSFPTALLTVYLLIAVFLRSMSLALAALLPTLLPIVVTLGSMGLLGLTLDVGRAMIGSVVIGIGVDDSIHLLSQYRIHRELGHNASDAIAGAMRHSGRAILMNALTLSLGFFTLLASPWQSISSFGFFVAIAILGALVSTLLVMPALIFTFAKENHT